MRPSKTRSLQLSRGVQCVTYDSYEADVYDDDRDGLGYYHSHHWTEPLSPSVQLSRVVEQVRAEVEPRRGVDAQPSRWSGADDYARRVHGHDLDVVAMSYLPWLVEQLMRREGNLHPRPLVGAMDVTVNAVNWHWVPLLDQQLFPCVLLHPAQPHKGHATSEQRNVPWAACFNAPLPDRSARGLHWTLRFHPLFRVEYSLPTLPAFLTWLQHHLSHTLPLDALMAEAEAVRGAVEWTRRGAVAALQLTYLVACYGYALPLPRLDTQLATAADDMRQLVGAERRYATLQAVDFAWCEQHVTAVEQLVNEWMSSPIMRTQREAWMKERQSHLTHVPYVVPPPSPLLLDTDPTGLVVKLVARIIRNVADDGNAYASCGGRPPPMRDSVASVTPGMHRQTKRTLESERTVACA